MGHDLEAPNGATSDWGSLYLARGSNEVVPYRPFFTGDVFAGVNVMTTLGVQKTKTVMLIQHPCAMRPQGFSLSDSLLVAEVRRHRVLEPREWVGSGKIMPLPDLMPEVDSSRRHQAVMFNSTFHVHPSQLDERIASLSLRGVNLLAQRWVYHSSRVVVPSFDFNAQVSPVYEEADLIEEWCEVAIGQGRTTDAAAYHAMHWLREDHGGVTRQAALEDPQRRSAVRKEMRQHVPFFYASGADQHLTLPDSLTPSTVGVTTGPTEERRGDDPA